MFKLVLTLIRKLFYDPYRFVSRNKHVTVGRSILGRSFNIDFRSQRAGVSLSVGDDCILMCSVVFESAEGHVRIGNRVFINGGTKLISRSSIEIEDDVTIAWDCTIYDHDSHSIDYRHRNADHQQQLIDWHSGNFIGNKNWDHVVSTPIRIRRNAWLGFGVVVLKGVTIGEGAIIGARSVVTRDVPPWTVAAGNPARVVKQLPVGSRPEHE